MGGEQRGRERRRCKFRCFTTLQKYPESRGGGGAQGEVHVEQRLRLSSQIHGKSSFHSLWFNESRPLSASAVAWEGARSLDTVHRLLPFESSSSFSRSLWPRGPPGVLEPSPKPGSECPGSPGQTRTGVSFMGHTAPPRKPTGFSEDAVSPRTGASHQGDPGDAV